MLSAQFVRILAAHLIGFPRKANLSVPATEADFTKPESILKDPLQDRLKDIKYLTPKMDKFLSIRTESFSMKKDSGVILKVI